MNELMTYKLNSRHKNTKPKRQAPLTIEEYERYYRLHASDLELIERIFYSGMASNELRAGLWPYVFGLVPHRCRFEQAHDGSNGFVCYDNEDNAERWHELENLYNVYKSQWDSIQPDQELRFSMFRERKSLIERDVIRSDRSHLFYAENMDHLERLTALLMTYMMFDFDIGYLQGMSDIAAPILFLFNGDPVKSFWVFVEVMKLFRRNFESSQKTIHFQLNCLYRLIKLTDPKFALYLNEIDCSNCFFVFRCIVCIFKRELMKSPLGQGHDYGLVFDLWDSIWTVQRRYELLAKSKYVHTFTVANRNGNGLEQSSAFNNNTNDKQSPLSRSRQIHNKQSPTKNPASVTNGNQFGRFKFSKSPSFSNLQQNGHLLTSNYNKALNSNGKSNGQVPQSAHISHQNTNGNKSNPPPRSKSFASCTCNLVSRHEKRKQQKLAMRRNGSYSISNPTYKTSSHLSPTSELDWATNGNQCDSTIISSHDDLPYLSNGHRFQQKYQQQNRQQQHQHSSPMHKTTSTKNGFNNNFMSLNHPSHHSHHLTSSPLSLSPNWSANWASQNSMTNVNMNQHEHVKQEQIIYTKETFYSSFDPNQADIPRFELTETEKFVLSLCLSLIRRERNYILAHQLDSTEIHQHFHDPKLSENLNDFIEQAYHIYHFLNSDCDIQLVLKEANELDLCLAVDDIMDDVDNDNARQADAADTYDLLRDYLIISPASHGNPAQYNCNMSRKSWDALVNNGE